MTSQPATEFQPGSLVRVRGRDWVVLPSADRDLVLVKPLDGGDDEVTGIYLPLGFAEDVPTPASFSRPTAEDLGSLQSGRLLYDGLRLSFRNGAGPFRSLGKISVRPRAYQMVPLIMALRQADSPLRLLIADDVGVGKTIEALLIVKELLERREIERFAVICLPHLCDQWQTELRDKFGIEAVIVRSSTQSLLDRNIRDDRSVFRYYPYQIVSVDYIKGEKRRDVFVNECPELVVVDEVHACARPSGANDSQQQRFRLLRAIADRKDQGLVLLSATPHSGKGEEFRSILGLLERKFEALDLAACTDKEREALARYFVQRRRADVQAWQRKRGVEDTPFPKRDSGEFAYELTPAYRKTYNRAFELARKMAAGGGTFRRARYWAALALLRGVMSSPAAGEAMVAARGRKAAGSGDGEGDEEAPYLPKRSPVEEEFLAVAEDSGPADLAAPEAWEEGERKLLADLEKDLKELGTFEKDSKAEAACRVLEGWIAKGFRPVVFCRYIATAKYLAGLLGPRLAGRFKDLDVQVVTGEDPDEVRKSRIQDMEKHGRRLLVCTDCLSEGINLQDYFTAVLHYDLPWNPNRLEQREGRVDRFGQKAREVKAFLLYGSDNPIDGTVLKVLLRKVREIRSDIGISLPFPEDSSTLMEAVMQAVLIKGEIERPDHGQGTLDFGAEEVLRATREIEEAAKREKASRSRFAQHALKAEEIEEDLAVTDEALGDPETVEGFTVSALRDVLGVQLDRLPEKGCWTLYTANLTSTLKDLLPRETSVKASFLSPVPEGHVYLGRNHPFVEALSRLVISLAFKRDRRLAVARAAAVRSPDVTTKTTLLLFRVRNVIEERRKGGKLVAEEMLFFGWEGSAREPVLLSRERTESLLRSARAGADVGEAARKDFLERELASLEFLESRFDGLAEGRAEALVDQHERFRRALSGRQDGRPRYQVVKPVLPMDLMGIYLLLPEIGGAK